MSKSGIPRCFFAYPSTPESLSETIETAIDSINGSGEVEAIGWRNLRVTGRLVIKEILNAIDDADIFACDLTFPNPNVLFELGYAVARNKRIWIILDSSYPQAKSTYQQMRILTTVGYSDYQNFGQILNAFFDEAPYHDLDNTLYKDVIESLLIQREPRRGLLYLKSVVNTDASTSLTRRLDKSKIGLTTDDPGEVSIQTLAWYAENAFHSHAVLSHLLDENRAAQYPLQNAKYSFVSGLAIGFRKPVLMLAHAPYEPPFDYQEYLQIHETSDKCIVVADRWLESIEASFEVEKQKIVDYQKEIEAAGVLQSIYLGDHIAENEQRGLIDYFVVTAAYQEALLTIQSRVFVGRKGSGKTANLFKLADEIGNDKRNYVSIIKPVDYDIEGILDLLNAYKGKAEQGFLMESLWKYLIYTELSMNLYEGLMKQAPHIQYSDIEKAFITFVDERMDLIEPDFSIRLENAIRRLCDIDLGNKSIEFRARVSENLHEKILGDLRVHLGLLLETKERVCILVDNLDKAWRRQQNLEILAEFLFGLLNVSRSIDAEFRKKGIAWREVNLSLILFLRSDIFSYLLSGAREADKLPFSRIDWSDANLLRRVVEQRFATSYLGGVTPDEVWSRIYTDMVDEEHTKDYILSRIIPRPRDIIYLCKASLAHAINRHHTRIEADDIHQAENEYSQYAYSTLISEIRPIVDGIENLIVEFAGVEEILTRNMIEDIYKTSGISSHNVDEIINLLVESLFLGIEIDQDDFRYLYDDSKKDVYSSLARKNMESTGIEKYQINTPFHSYLEIKNV